MILKYNGFFQKWEVDSAYLFKDFSKPAYTKDTVVKIPVWESSGFLSLGSRKKLVEVVKDMPMDSPRLAGRAEKIINRGYELFKAEQDQAL